MKAIPALHFAAQNGHLEVATILIKNGIKIIRGRWRFTATRLAIGNVTTNSPTFLRENGGGE